MSSLLSDVISSKEFVSSLAGAFIGAIAAFTLNALREVVVERNKKHAALVRAQYTLASQAQTLKGILVQYLERYRSDPGRGSMIPMLSPAWTALRLDFQELAFLASSESAQVLNEIMLAQACYETSERAHQYRNAAKEEFRRVSKNPVAFIPSSVAAKVVIDSSNEVELAILESITTSLYTSIDDAIPKLEAAIKILERTGKELFFDKKFLRFEWKTGKAPEAARRPEV